MTVFMRPTKKRACAVVHIVTSSHAGCASVPGTSWHVSAFVVGIAVGAVGAAVGPRESGGAPSTVGAAEGANVAPLSVGHVVGTPLGAAVGALDGPSVGDCEPPVAVGDAVGATVGRVGMRVGSGVGSMNVGIGVGYVGCDAGGIAKTAFVVHVALVSDASLAQ